MKIFRWLFPLLLTLCICVPASADDLPPRINLEGVGRLPAFSHATIGGDLIFVSGMLGTEPGTIDIVPGGIGPQTTRALENAEQILKQIGADRRYVVKCTVFLATMDDYAAMNEAYIAFFGDSPPARSTVAVKGLALGAVTEIECIAQLPENANVADASDAPPLPAAPKKGFVASDGEEIYYEVTGEGAPVVFSHGLGGNHAIWYQQVPAFARDYQVVTWDQRGFGRSTNRAKQAGPAAFTRDLEALLRELEIERAHLIGQSMGGWTVMGFATAHPDRVLSVTLADTIGGIYNESIRESFVAYIQASLGGGGGESPMTLAQHPAVGTELSHRDPAQGFLYSQIGSVAGPPPRGIAGKLLGTAYPLEAIAAFDFPFLFVVGSDDPIFPPATIREASTLVPGSRVVEIPGSGHSPYFERPDTWNYSVLEFLNEME